MTRRCRSFPLAWLFHANTARFAHNAEPPAADVWPLPPREDPVAPVTRLAPPPASPLQGLLERRGSCRRFADGAIGLEALAAVLHAGYGVTGHDHWDRVEFATRTVPSGGALYPLELTVIARRVEGLAPGIHHYLPEQHALEEVLTAGLPDALLAYLFMGQATLTAAPALVVISAVWGRSLMKYGDRGYRYLLLEAGHAMQNVNLACPGVGLESCNIGGFFDHELAGLLRMDPELETPLYACALGRPRDEDRMRRRDL
jgi:SagB-type dehydrogenase family enzyme